MQHNTFRACTPVFYGFERLVCLLLITVLGFLEKLASSLCVPKIAEISKAAAPQLNFRELEVFPFKVAVRLRQIFSVQRKHFEVFFLKKMNNFQFIFS